MRYKKLFYFLVFLFIVSPVGVLTDSPAWGEWEKDFYKAVLGFIPEGIKEGVSFSFIPDYSFDGLNPVLSYYLSGIVGVVLIFFTFFTLKILLSKKDER